MLSGLSLVSNGTPLEEHNIHARIHRISHTIVKGLSFPLPHIKAGASFETVRLIG